MRFFTRFWQVSRTTTLHSYYHTPRRVVMDPLVVIYGSTGTGKSDLAVELATRFNGEIINADAMQMYKGLPIITNQLSDEEQRGIKHHLLANLELGEDSWSVSKFKPEATRIISEIRARGKLPIVVGGTSYYLDSLLFQEKLIDGLDLGEDEDFYDKNPILRESGEAMLKKLRELDPVMAEKWHPADTRKIRHSLEICLYTGRRVSDIYAEQQSRLKSKGGSVADSAPWQTLVFWLYAKPEMLNERLMSRVDRMVERGLITEVSEVYNHLQEKLSQVEVVDQTRGIWQSIGVKHFEPYLSALKEKAENPEEAARWTPFKLEKLKQNCIHNTKVANRRYAKQQIKWIGTKTITSMQEENVLDRFFLLDSSDISRFGPDVLEKGADLTERFLTGKEPLPDPLEVSETAREVFDAHVERRDRLRAAVACNKTCDVCDKSFTTEQTWQVHLKSNKHRVAWNRKKRRALVVVQDPEHQQKEGEIVPLSPPLSSPPPTAQAMSAEEQAGGPSPPQTAAIAN
ncbi:IPP transferase domain containing protein [Naviculisporaceae sp. PSN 640]